MIRAFLWENRFSVFGARDEADIHELALALREQGVSTEQEDDTAGLYVMYVIYVMYVLLNWFT